jgi:sirohydrochlorin ferrochelatase
MTTPLIAVAHGSRDPRSAQTVTAIVESLRAARPDLHVRPAFLDLSTPSVPEAVAGLAAQGHRAAVVVPLLLGSAYHARVDLPALLDTARRRHPGLVVTQTDVLAPDPRLVAALRDRLRHAGVDPADPDTGVAVAAVGSSSRSANSRTRDIARRLRAGTAWRTETCFATAEPGVATAAAALRARGARRIVLAPWFLAPGLLTDRLAAHGLAMSAPLGPHPALLEVILDRHHQATRHTRAA